jgi:hypothetical protein
MPAGNMSHSAGRPGRAHQGVPGPARGSGTQVTVLTMSLGLDSIDDHIESWPRLQTCSASP